MSEQISRFTPSVMPAATLESIFVAREPLLTAIMKRIEAAALTDTRNQTLLVGPRGSGKTHLVALAYHRTKSLIEQGRSLQVAWLPEDAWTIASYRHLLGTIADRLEGQPTINTKAPTAEMEFELVQRAQRQGTIVVFLENLDRVLTQLGRTGQQQLRHFLQHDCRMLLIATSTSLDRNLADQAQPFYGFFTTTRLRPFTAEEGRDMLAAIATHAGNQPLADFLRNDPTALNRIKAIAHLAGGQPRLWALLSSSLEISELTSLVDLLLTRFDDLTPYYQEQLAAISPLQRLIVAELATADHPLHVAAIADLLEVDQRSVAKAIGELVERSWLTPVTTVFANLLDRRRTYYELAEPLAKLAFQLKESRGEPLRLVVDFLKSWFDPTDLAQLDADAHLKPYLESVREQFVSDSVGGVVRRLSSLPATRAPALDLLGRLDDALAATTEGDASAFLEIPSSLRLVMEERLSDQSDRETAVLALRSRLHLEALAEIGHTPTQESASWAARAEQLLHTRPSDRRLRLILVVWLSRSRRFEEAEVALASLSSLNDTALATLVLADAFDSSGASHRAIELYERACALYEQVGGPNHPDTLRCRAFLAQAYETAGDLSTAIGIQEQVLASANQALGPEHPDTLSYGNSLAVAYAGAGDLQRAIALHEQTFTGTQQALGPEHRNTLISRSNLANTYAKAGDPRRAIAVHEEILAARERLFGAEHPDTVDTRDELAILRRRSAQRADGDPGASWG